jgi:hypothetical protein
MSLDVAGDTSFGYRDMLLDAGLAIGGRSIHPCMQPLCVLEIQSFGAIL